MTSHNVCPSCRGEFHPHLSEHYYVVDLGWVTQNKNKNKERVLMVLTHSLFFLDDIVRTRTVSGGKFKSTSYKFLDDIFLVRKISSRFIVQVFCLSNLSSKSGRYRPGLSSRYFFKQLSSRKNKLCVSTIIVQIILFVRPKGYCR